MLQAVITIQFGKITQLRIVIITHNACYVISMIIGISIIIEALSYVILIPVFDTISFKYQYFDNNGSDYVTALSISQRSI